MPCRHMQPKGRVGQLSTTSCRAPNSFFQAKVRENIMGSSDDVKPSKLEKSSSVATDKNNIHLYPDWAGMQAYYGPRFAIPPYMNSAVASPHAPPPYMWAPPQSMMPPYGAPYAAFYAHGGVYAHPGVPMASTTLNMETPAKSIGNTDGSFVKKLKEPNGLAMSIGNGSGDSADHGTERRTSDSEETGGSSDGSNGVTPQAGQRGKKRSRQGSPNNGDIKAPEKSSEAPAVEVGQASEKTVDVITPAANVPVKPIENTNTALVLKDVKSSPITVPSQSMPSETYLQNEKEMKRERRKQSNRESARRSRLRKQAETEELAVKVQVLTAENITLKSEINKLIESSEHLKLQNATLMEKLKDAELGPAEDNMNLVKLEDQRLKPVGTVNLLARVNNSDSGDRRNTEDSGDPHENRSPRAKLSQLLDTSPSPRADALAAS
ncbi:G-box-binding factor 3 [Striga hermonthica]|uniref:G-box-binding factor 3 n=1 Tax=Striga hermonthica TaxID=68872 RepID=A0A9N7R774_STRHE|nr:G-box-binding factor 3 [Striga hermonthica]